MASLGHIAVGMAAARAYRGGALAPWKEMAWWSALSMLPDADVITFAMGIGYADAFGHRGATHSFVFAAAVAVVLGVAARAIHLPPLRTAVVAALVVASHAMLDTMTTGGLGCALLWPFDLSRYFAPWRPIPVAPIGLAFLSISGLIIAAIEIVLFAPVLLYAFARKPAHWTLVVAWAIATWLIASRDPVRESLVGFVLRERTEYTRGYSEEVFRAIAIGQRESDVQQRLGEPFGEYWDYFSDDGALSQGGDTACPFVYLESGAVVVGARDIGPATTRCAQRGITAGVPRTEVLRLLGTPRVVCRRYSRGSGGRAHRARTVCFSEGKVTAVVRQWEPD